MKLVLVEWLDSHSGRGWQSPERITQAAEPLYCQSVGWLFEDKKDCKVIVPHIAGQKGVDEVMQGCGDRTVPAASIIKMTTLRR